MDKLEERKLGRKMLAFEKAQIEAGLRGPLPEYKRTKKPKACGQVKRLARILTKIGPSDAAEITTKMQMPAPKVRGVIQMALAAGAVRKVPGIYYRTYLYEVACDE